MIEYRAFRNSDTPHVARVWNAQPQRRGLAQPVSPRLLEELVYSKLYFDRAGLQLAWADGRVVGFAHAGFGPNEGEDDICTEMGAICLLLVEPREDATKVARGLIRASEEYLQGQGAKLLYAGAVKPLNSFYLGLYGGSELPGVLASDEDLLGYYLQNGYQEIDRCVIFQRDLNERMKPQFDRRLTMLRRRYTVGFNRTFTERTWWSACTAPLTDTVRLELLPRKGGPPCGGLTIWNVEPLGRSWGVATAGLHDLQVPPDLQRGGLATYLNIEAIKYLQSSRMGLVEAQTMRQNTAAIGLYQKLGFQEVDQGVVLRKAT